LTGFDTIEQASRTDIGLRRSHNQDAFAIDMAAPEGERFREHGHLFLVADGMGGHAVGEKASAKAVRDIPHTYHKHVAEGPDKALKRAFVETNAGIFAIGQENPEFRGLGTTASALLLRAEGAWIAHVGDSRVYRVRSGQIDQLTFDHSAVWEIARRQQVSPGELQGIRSNVILRSLGPDSLVDVDIEGPHPILPGDVFLLCSDGLSGQLTDYEIGAVAASLPPEEACDFLVELANLRGGPDNITVLIAKAGSADKPPVQVIDANLPRPARRGVPWPLTVLFAGIALAILAVVLKAAELPGVMPAFVVATAVIGIGLFGIGLHSQREPARELESPKPRLNVYSTTRCQIERPLLDKLIAAANALKQRLDDLHVGWDDAAFVAHRTKADQFLASGSLADAFREHCRAMHGLIKTHNQQRQKEEVFQPVWDKHDI
jgi:protein phosphatase